MRPIHWGLIVACALLVSQQVDAGGWSIQIQVNTPWEVTTLTPTKMPNGRVQYCSRVVVDDTSDVVAGLKRRIIGGSASWRVEWEKAKARDYCTVAYLPKCADGKGLEVTGYVLSGGWIKHADPVEVIGCRP